MRALFVALALIVAVPAWASPAAAEVDTGERAPSNAPFRVKLVTNAAAAQRTAARLAALSKQPPPAKLSASDRRLYAAHSKWLSDSAARFASVHARMAQVLAKGDKAPITEVATTNMELVNLREVIELEAKRFIHLARAARPRHASAMSAVRADT